jgi:site-specific DNA recombinase
MIAAIYARKSTDQSTVADEAKSTTRQIAHARAYAKSKGWTVDARFIYCDDGITGATFTGRPAFMKLMAVATQQPKPTARRPAAAPGPPFQILIVSDLDRLGREAIETTYSIKRLAMAGVQTFSYLENKEIKLDSPVDALMTQVSAFAAAVERQKGSQRATDVMQRKARAGHVTGGRVFGFDNLRVDGHVERRINEPEAAVVRRIFALCLAGCGQVSIAKQLNEDGAPAPRTQQGGPAGWCASSVREVLRRSAYRGVVIWNRTKKRSTWGVVKPTKRPESEWLMTVVPGMRIIAESTWQQVQAHLAQRRANYLTSTNGAVWGRPTDPGMRRWLLVGLSRCGVCGGNMEVRSRQHGSTRVAFYACLSHYRKGASICANHRLIKVSVADESVLGTIERDLLTPEFVAGVIAKVGARASSSSTSLDAERTEIDGQLQDVQRQVDRLIETAARTGNAPSVVAAISKREDHKAQLQQQLDALVHTPPLSDAAINRVAALARTKIADWRGVMHRNIPVARQVLGLLLIGRITLTPAVKGRRSGYKWAATGSLAPLLQGLVAGSAQAVASPTRLTQKGGWLRKAA